MPNSALPVKQLPSVALMTVLKSITKLLNMIMTVFFRIKKEKAQECVGSMLPLPEVIYIKLMATKPL
jgi:hypothetical protein